jgi:ribosomal protein S18 acetylase RimI-like enzyme
MSELRSLPGSGISFLPATWRDLKAVHQLEKNCFQLDAWPLLDILGVLTLPQLIRIKAQEGDQLIGFVAADLRQVQATAWIATLAVLPSYRRKGIGSCLLESCEDGISLPLIRLCVRESNLAAINLYLKYGYQQVETWKKYYRGGDNALVFEKIVRSKTSPRENPL